MVDTFSKVMWDLSEATLSKPPYKRETVELESLLTWFRLRSQLFKFLEDDVLIDIMKNVTLTRCRKDHIIVRQGEKGNCFYIILKGSASVYAKREGEGDVHHHPETSVRSHKERPMLFGTELSTLRAGRSFGEMVMVDEKKERNATVIADESTTLISIDEVLYRRSLCLYNREWTQKAEFINTSSLFASWPAAFKSLIIENLKFHRVDFENFVVRQNAPCESVFFIAQGLAKVTVSPVIAAKQYKAWKPPQKKKKSPVMELPQDEESDEDVSKALTVIQKRRKRMLLGYAAMERRQRARAVHVAIIGKNDVIGSIEMTLDLPTYCASVECMESLECYELDKSSYHRLIGKRNPETLALIQKVAIAKLEMRAERLDHIPLLRLLVLRANTKTPAAKSAAKAQKRRKLSSIGKAVTMLGFAKKNVNKTKLTERLILKTPATPATPTTAPGTADDNRASDSTRLKPERRSKKENKKQYTAEEFRALKKKVQSTGKLIGRVSD